MESFFSISNLGTILLYFFENWTMNEDPAKWPNGWAQRKKLFSLPFLGEVRQWMNTRREIVSTTSWQKWDDGWIWGNLIKRNRIMELRQASWAFYGKWDNGWLYKGNVLVEKVAPWRLITYRRLKFFQFPKECWTILDLGWNIIELLEENGGHWVNLGKMEFGWAPYIGGKWNKWF